MTHEHVSSGQKWFQSLGIVTVLLASAALTVWLGVQNADANALATVPEPSVTTSIASSDLPVLCDEPAVVIMDNWEATKKSTVSKKNKQKRRTDKYIKDYVNFYSTFYPVYYGDHTRYNAQYPTTFNTYYFPSLYFFGS